MATGAVSRTDVQALMQSRRNLMLALLWGGVMLGIFGLWIKVKHADLNVALPALLLLEGIASVGLALFLFRPTPQQLSQAPEAELARLDRQRHGIGLLVTGAGVVLLVIAGWLGYTQGLRSLGESCGLGVFALLAIVGGLMHASSGRTSQEAFFQGLTEKKANVSVALLFVGLGLLVLGVYLRLKPFSADPANWFPLWVGAGLLGLVLSAGGGYLRVAMSMTPTAMRLFILCVGGLSGLIIAFFTFCMAWIWRADVFFAGVSGWNGENGWRLWLCAYAELIGLALLFGSLLLARADVRVYPTLRRVLYGYNAVLTGLLVLIFLVALNIVVIAAYPLSLNWTEVQGLYGLSDKTVDLLEKLKEPTTVYLVMSERFPTYGDMRRFLQNCQAITDKLKVVLIDPESPADAPRYNELAQKYKELQPPLERNPRGGGSEGRGVLLVYGAEDTDKDPKRVMVGADKLQDTHTQEPRNPDEKQKKTYRFQGEVAVMTELQHFMVGEKKTKVYFLQGNGELDIGRSFGAITTRQRAWNAEMAATGGSVFVERLEKENIEVKGLSFASADKGKPDPRTVHITGDQRKEVPKDCQVLVIAGPSRKMPKDTLNAIERYLDSGNDKRLLVMFDIVSTDAEVTAMLETGLESVLQEKVGIEVTKDYAFRYAPDLGFQDPIPATMVLAQMVADSDNAVAKKFSRPFQFDNVRVVKPGKGGRLQATTVMEAVCLPDEFVVWAESDMRLLKKRVDQIKFGKMRWNAQPDLRDYRSTVPIGVAAQQDGKPRIVVLGNAGMASNFELSQANNAFNLLASFIDWLTDRPGLGVRPREQGVFTISPKIRQEWGRITLMPGWLMTLGVLGLGLGAWVVRRK